MSEPSTPTSPPRRRRNRKPKACRTCRARKVRCDYGRPCNTCVQRHHPELCRYDARSRNAVELSRDGQTDPQSPPPQDHLLGVDALQTPPETTPTDDIDDRIPTISPTRPETHTTRSDHVLTVLDYLAENTNSSCETDTIRNQTTSVGRRAPANIFRALLSYHSINADLPRHVSIETLFGLSNQPMSRPFASLWNTTARVTMGDIIRALPPAETCMKFYRAYQQIAQPFYPVLIDPASFERKLCRVVDSLDEERDKSPTCTDRLATDAPPKELAWFALLLAVLASGCQCSGADTESSLESGLHSRMLVACSWECLRVANLSVNPSAEMMQACLILASVTCNDDNPGVTWGTLGMTARLAQGLGLGLGARQRCSCGLPSCTCLQSVHPFWRAVSALDSQLASMFDRLPVCFRAGPEGGDEVRPLLSASRVGFRDVMFALDCLRVRWLAQGSRDDGTSVPADQVSTFLQLTGDLEKVTYSTKSDLRRTTSFQSMLERLIFAIHLDFFQGTLHYHAAVACDTSSEQRQQDLHGMTLKYCSVIRGYVKLRTLSPIARVAWDLIRAATSSALLLAAFGVALQDTSSWLLLHQMAAATRTAEREDDLPTPEDAFTAVLTSLLRLQTSS